MSNLMLDGVMFEKIEPAKISTTVIATPDSFEKILAAMDVSHITVPQLKTEDFIFPKPGEGRDSLVTTLPGGEHLGEIADLKQFDEKLTTGLRVPKSYFKMDELKEKLASGKFSFAEFPKNATIRFLDTEQLGLKSFYYTKSRPTAWDLEFTEAAKAWREGIDKVMSMESSELNDLVKTEPAREELVKKIEDDAMFLSHEYLSTKYKVMYSFGLLADEADEFIDKAFTEDTKTANTMFLNDYALDRTFGGFKRGETMVLAGVYGTGRTSVAVRVAADLINQHHRVLFVGTDSTRHHLTERFMKHVNSGRQLDIAMPGWNEAELFETLDCWCKENQYDAIMVEDVSMYADDMANRDRVFERLIQYGRERNVAMVITQAIHRKSSDDDCINNLSRRLTCGASKIIQVSNNGNGFGTLRVIKDRREGGYNDRMSWYEYDTGKAGILPLEHN